MHRRTLSAHRRILSAHAFWGLRGAAPLWGMHSDGSNVLTEPDPREIIAITSGLIKINHVVMTRMGLRSNNEFGIADLMD